MTEEFTQLTTPIATGAGGMGIGVGIEASAVQDTGGTTAGTVLWFKMRGIDANAATTPPTYRSWTVRDTPDFDASRFSGPFSGGSPNITSITVQAEFETSG